jgi:hypothetical protein
LLNVYVCGYVTAVLGALKYGGNLFVVSLPLYNYYF